MLPPSARISPSLLKLAALGVLCLPASLAAQTPAAPAPAIQTKAFTLPHEPSQAGYDDPNMYIFRLLQNMLARDSKVYLDTSKDVIFVQSTPDQIALADRLIHEAAQPQHSYRLTYTLVETDAGKRVGVQHYSMVVLGNGIPTSMKQGSKIPLATGVTGAKSEEATTQFTYIDIGMNFNAALTTSASGLYLKSKVEESSAEEHTTVQGVVEPIVRQSVLEGNSALLPGKPLTLGSIDISGSTRRIDIEVIAEVVS